MPFPDQHNSQHKKLPRQQKGFTLIELVVVMSIVALLALVSYRVITIALDTRQAVTTHNESLREFELGLFLLKQDIQQIQIRPLANFATDKSSNSSAIPLYSQFGQSFSSRGQLLQFQKSADRQLLEGASQITYKIEKNQLLRQKTSITGEQFVTPLLNQISEANIVFFDEKNKQFSEWKQPKVPSLMTLTLKHQRYGTVIIQESFNE